MSQTKLFEPYKLGPITLPNRLVMAPLTRNRAVPPGMVPSPLAIEYYGQRASAGLLITEASQVSQQGQGYQDTPGIYSKEQVAGWRKVTDRVHERGGRIFIQIWHVGRVSHTCCSPAAARRWRLPPSARRARPSSTAASPTFPSRVRWRFPNSRDHRRLQASRSCYAGSGPLLWGCWYRNRRGEPGCDTFSPHSASGMPRRPLIDLMSMRKNTG